MEQLQAADLAAFLVRPAFAACIDRGIACRPPNLGRNILVFGWLLVRRKAHVVPPLDSERGAGGIFCCHAGAVEHRCCSGDTVLFIFRGGAPGGLPVAVRSLVNKMRTPVSTAS